MTGLYSSSEFRQQCLSFKCTWGRFLHSRLFLSIFSGYYWKTVWFLGSNFTFSVLKIFDRMGCSILYVHGASYKLIFRKDSARIWLTKTNYRKGRVYRIQESLCSSLLRIPLPLDHPDHWKENKRGRPSSISANFGFWLGLCAVTLLLARFL